MKFNPAFIPLFFLPWFLFPCPIHAQPQIGVYPPQIHQQICQESTFTRQLDVINYGNEPMNWNAGFTPGPYTWVTASPSEGLIGPKDTVQISFYFNSSGLAIDNYYAYLQINSNDPVHPDTTILAMLHVQQMDIFIEPESDSICFGCNTTLNTMVFGCSEDRQYNWTSDPPGFQSTEKSPVVAPAGNTKYIVTVTDGGGTARDSAYIKVYGSSGIDELDKSLVNLYPNPAHGKFSVYINSSNEGAGLLNISDFSGRLVYIKEIELKKGNHGYEIGKHDLIPGIYLLNVEIVSEIDGYYLPAIKLIIN